MRYYTVVFEFNIINLRYDHPKRYSTIMSTVFLTAGFVELLNRMFAVVVVVEIFTELRLLYIYIRVCVYLILAKNIFHKL